MLILKILELNNWPIRYKLTVFFLLIGILPSLFIAVSIGWAVDKIMEKQANDNTLQIIAKVNKSLENYISDMQNITYLISFNPDIRKFLYEDHPLADAADANKEYDIRKFLQEFTTLHPEIAGILVVNKNGLYISNEMYTRTTKSLTEDEWYVKAVRNKGIFTLIGHPKNWNVTTHFNYKDDDVVSVVRAILDPDTQETKGVVLIDLKLRVLAETVKDVRLGKTGYLMIMDDSGENIYSPPHPLIPQIRKEWFGDSASGMFAKRIDGNRIQFIYLKSSFTGWTTIGVFSSKETVMAVREVRFYLVSFVFLVCMLGIAASYYLSHSLSRPIRQLMSFMQKAESGDLTIRHASHRTDEVGLLGRSFNRMLTKINQLISLVEDKERQKREAELRTLQAHIKPHFLYNTLDTIHWMSIKNGARDVAEVVESLSKLFRIGLSNGQEMISVLDEIEHVESYLNIQKTRYRDKLHSVLEWEPSVQDCFVLKLIVQPIVENAIYHGIKERRGPGTIRIALGTEASMLIIRITDDGLGIEKEKLDVLRRRLDAVAISTERQLPPKMNREGGADAPNVHNPRSHSGGYGLLNVHERIRLTFGEPYGLRIDSERGKGTTVTILHPILKKESGR
jgi:two-component system sensor histidine kinase YesM